MKQSRDTFILLGGLGWAHVGIGGERQLDGGMPDKVLQSLDMAAREGEAGGVGVAQVVQPVGLHDPRILLRPPPAAAKRLRRAGDDVPRAIEPEGRAQQRREFDGDWYVPRSGSALAGLVDQLTTDAETLAPDVQASGSNVDVAPLEAEAFAPAQASVTHQSEGQIAGDDGPQRGPVLAGDRAARSGFVLWLVDGVGRIGWQMAGADRTPQRGVQERVRQLRLSAARLLLDPDKGFLDQIGRDGCQVDRAEDRREETLQPRVTLPGLGFDLALIQRQVQVKPFVIGHDITSRMIVPHPIMAKYYSLLPLPQGCFAEDNLSLIDRAVFGLIYDRWKLSSYHVLGTAGSFDWYDEEFEDVFCVFAQDELARLVGVSDKTIRRSLITLKKLDYVYWAKRGFMGANRYFITKRLQAYMSALRKDTKAASESP